MRLWSTAFLAALALLTACGSAVDENGRLVEKPPSRTAADDLYYCAGLMIAARERGEVEKWLGAGVSETDALAARLEEEAKQTLRNSGQIRWEEDVRTARRRTGAGAEEPSPPEGARRRTTRARPPGFGRFV